MYFRIRSLLQGGGLPPMFLLWVLFMGLLFKPWLAWVALALFYLLSTTPVATLLVRPLEQAYPVFNKSTEKPEGVIVVLGGGMPGFSPERPGYRPSMSTLERLRHTAWLQNQTDLPILVSGGGIRPEAETMARSLEEDFSIEVKWLEDQSRTTRENALYTREMLPDNINTVILVTHAWHMPRSVLSFHQAGFRVIPAPTVFHTHKVHWQGLTCWLPRTRNLAISERAIREYVGYLWYLLVFKYSD